MLGSRSSSFTVLVLLLCLLSSSIFSVDAVVLRRRGKRGRKTSPLLASHVGEANFVTISTSDGTESETVDTVTPHVVARNPSEGKIEIDVGGEEKKLMKRVRKQLSEHLEKIESLEEKNSELQEKIASKPVEVNVEAPSPTPIVHDGQLVELQKELQRATIAKKAAEKKAKLASSPSSVASKVQNALAEISTLKSQIADTQKGGEVAIQALRDSNDNLNSKLIEKDSEIDELTSKITSLEAAATKATSDFKMAAEKMGEEMMDQEKKDIEEALGLLRDAYDAKIGALNGSIESVEAERDDFKSQVLNLAAKIASEHAASSGGEASSSSGSEGGEGGDEGPAEGGEEATPAEEEAPAEGGEEGGEEEAPAEGGEGGEEAAPASGEEAARFKETRSSIFAKSQDFFNPKVKHDPAI